MRNGTKGVIAVSTFALASVGVTGLAVASGGGDDTERPISADAVDQASAVALQHVGAGRVTGTEVGDEESYYEVEVTRDDGSQVDVQLDEAFVVVGDEVDSGTEDDATDG